MTITDDNSTLAHARFASGVNHIVIRTSDAGNAQVDAHSLADDVFVEILSTGCGGAL